MFMDPIRVDEEMRASWEIARDEILRSVKNIVETELSASTAVVAVGANGNNECSSVEFQFINNIPFFHGILISSFV